MEIAAIKVVAPEVARWVIDRAIQAYGAAGVSQDTPLASLYAHARTLQIADGPDEVHRRSVARQSWPDGGRTDGDKHPVPRPGAGPDRRRRGRAVLREGLRRHLGAGDRRTGGRDQGRAVPLLPVQGRPAVRDLPRADQRSSWPTWTGSWRPATRRRPPCAPSSPIWWRRPRPGLRRPRYSPGRCTNWPRTEMAALRADRRRYHKAFREVVAQGQRERRVRRRRPPRRRSR